ncbi:hypothetical protein SAMD00019534_037910 [Acytostelium subglobosum LB1]|uniref:hypothetical protein n=1 Tax=Acytostelium subglobosum LB1 TaxID=1410327 RepID=UPI000644AB80|nr:hypothetical protein SAMD00019534_037910 [Acytostelium subglobosum LB1]GAM20616.1 hypothetical protein SAMD00019534_037910 [Acytostelium subglobosum LB1]|eukprot:XP_012760137.1 hypothetical protein SAMD00019534_037910 [Acytostelium subglobosum LB1]
MRSYISLLLISCLVWTVIIGCPDYPTPVKIDTQHPILLKAYAEVDALLQERMQENGIKSFMATIVYQDDLVWSNTYGKVNPLDPNSPPLSIDNNIRIASITKSFGTLMMYQLRDKGVLSLDEPVNKYYPEFTIMNPFITKKDITFRQLASHQAGLPREVPCNFDMLDDPNVCGEETIMENLAKYILILPQYQTAHYSNLGLALLGRTCEKAAKQKYEDYVEEKILSPLGMDRSTYNYSAVKDNMAIGMHLDNGTYSVANITLFGWGTPMGGLFSTGRDMAKYCSFWLSDGGDILDSSTMNEAIVSTVYLVNDGQSSFGTPWETMYSTGLQNNLWIRMKGGALDGYRSQLAMVREYGVGVFFSSLMYISTPDLFVGDAMNILLPAFDQVLREAQAPPELSGYPAEAFIGIYEYEGSIFRVQMLNGSLQADFGDDNYFSFMDFLPEFPTVKRIQIMNTNPYMCMFINDGENYELCYFTISGDHATSALVMGQEMLLTSKDPTIPIHPKRSHHRFLL